ncbi:hypothetical protein BB560_006812 [Smittium megazygosporum]|uniref:Uncharacterized protein n=1 Tax=Smittium megazygosporum TaxID=133381 RepID=A0A2T9Y163_9FUNG|nr:hypothetical protein BB560_006812 [Smittium megazygosporum]
MTLNENPKKELIPRFAMSVPPIPSKNVSVVYKRVYGTSVKMKALNYGWRTIKILDRIKKLFVEYTYGGGWDGGFTFELP